MTRRTSTSVGVRPPGACRSSSAVPPQPRVLPGTPACPTPGGTVEGDIDAADVIGPAGQGIEVGAFNEILAAMRAGAAYANVHSTKWPAGEIRAQVKKGRGGDHDNGKGKKGHGGG